MRFLLSLLALAAFSTADASSFSAASGSKFPQVQLDYSTVRASAGNTSIGYYKFQNIRFASPPTGDLRFAAPQWPTKETQVNNGSVAAANVACSTTEDCLFLDIYAPADALGRNLPVLVFTYGGRFLLGSKSLITTPEGLFDLSKDFIYVAYNYRLGLTGLATGPTYQHQGGVSNLALWDAQHAFKWIKKYISKFGGNPNDLTAVGFSAGGSNLLFQLTRFGGDSEQLFQKAYFMSSAYIPGAGHEHGEAFWQNVSAAVGCTGGDLSCMRQVDFTTLSTTTTQTVAANTYKLQPRVDGYFVTDTFESLLYQGRFNFNGPIVVTHELHEINAAAVSGVSTEDDIRKYLRIFLPAITDAMIDEVLDLYPAENYASSGLRFADIEQSFEHTSKDYAITQAFNNQTWNAVVALNSASHGVDQNYYFYRTYNITDLPAATTALPIVTPDPAIATKMQKYLLSFVLTGNPNTKWANDKLYWPRYSESPNGAQLVFNTTFSTADDELANDRSKFWNKALWY